MAKRKPPSHRPERALDETARAIARLRESEKGEKSEESSRPSVDNPALARLSKSVAPRKINTTPVFPSTKRPKTG